MMGNTHLAVGIASALVIAQPKTKSSIIAAVIGGAVGGIMSDIDVKIDRSNKYAKKASTDALYGEIAAIVLSVALLVADFFGAKAIITPVISNPISSIVGLIGFIILTIIGEKSKHRDKTHSILAMLLFSNFVAMIHLYIGACFLCGYASHLFIDLFNKSPERLFYPFKKGICFKCCYADQLGNTLFFAFGIGIIAIYLALWTGI